MVQPNVYERLPIGGGTASPVNSSDGFDTPFSVDMPFPVTFFGNSFSQLRMSPDGWISFNMNQGSAWQSQPIPNTLRDPQNLIAAWWQDTNCAPGQMKRQTLGSAPSRIFILEWDRCTNIWDHGSRAGFQLWFFEGSTTLETHYDTIEAGTWTTSIGIENASSSVGFSPLTCNSGCTAAAFPAGQKVIFGQSPDVAVTSLSTDLVVYAGAPIELDASTANRGGEPANGVRLQFWLSTDPVLSSDDWLLGRAPEAHDLGIGGTGTFHLSTLAPVDLEIGRYFLLAEADPDNVVGDTNRTNNVAAFGPLELGRPTADLVVGKVAFSEGEVLLGDSFTVEWDLSNIGNLEALDIAYSVVLSDNEVISSSDREVYRGLVSADKFTEGTIRTIVTIPEDMKTGLFHVGILIDPEWMLEELSKLNNVGWTDALLNVRARDLSIKTPAVWEAEVSSTWTIQLEADGGDGFFEWTVESGSLPPGLSLVVERDERRRPLYTVVTGSPTKTGRFTFGLRVQSGELSKLEIIELNVKEPGAIVVTIGERLLAASFGVEYEGRLLAAGGTAPYQWSLLEGPLPPGLGFSRTGLIGGIPEKDGTYSLLVEVTDAAGRVAEGRVSLVVAPPGKLTCRTEWLPVGKVGEEIEPTQLLAAGGVPPYSFASGETRRLAVGTADHGELFADQPPPGLSLDGEGVVRGAPAAAGRYVWVVTVTDDRRIPKECRILFDVTYEQGPAILTTALPDGFVDTPYSVQLQQFGADEPAIWSLAPGSRLPDGLNLSPGGAISGMPSLSSLEGEADRIFPFVVRVRDHANREATESLSIRIYRVPPGKPLPGKRAADEEGCQAAGGGTNLFALVAAAALMYRRRVV